MRYTHELHLHYEDSVRFVPFRVASPATRILRRSTGPVNRERRPETPLLGFSKFPLHRHIPVASGPSFPPEGRLPSAEASHRFDTFRPCRSSRLRRLSPHPRPQVCCTLQPIMRFARFWETPRPDHASCLGRRARLPRTRSPLKAATDLMTPTLTEASPANAATCVAACAGLPPPSFTQTADAT